MFRDNLKVKRPNNTIVYKNNNYVYLTKEKIYLKDKKHNQNKRVCIGKMIDKEYMIPNENYEDYFPSLYELKKPPILSDSLSVGLSLIVDGIMKDKKIDDLLIEIFEEDYCLIKDLIIYTIYEESTVIQHFPNVMRRFPIYSDLIYSDSYISNFFKENITDKRIELFLDAWNQINKKDNIYISYDSTNMTTSSAGISLAEYGHSKDNDDLPQVNLSYAINQKEALPLFYELYPGSIIDNSQAKHMIARLREYGYKDIGVILDRGYYSKANIKYLEKNNYSYILMIKTNQSIIQDLISDEGLKLIFKGKDKYYIDYHEVYGLTKKIKQYPKDKHYVYVHLYYDIERAAYETKQLSKQRSTLEKELNYHLEAKLKKREDLTRYNKLFKLKYDDNGYLLSYKINDKYIDDKSFSSGFFCIITSEEMSAKEALDIYRNRDIIEKLFESLKSELDYKKFRVSSNSSLKGKTFITFLANIIRSRIHYDTKALRNKNKKDYTIPAIINELSNIEITRNAKGIYVRRHSLTSKQKNILAKFNIQDKDIDKITDRINNQQRV